MITPDGWVDWANQVRPPLAPQKRYPEANRGEGIVWHSQEGYGYAVMQSILLGRRQTSFMFWIGKNGRLVQFAPVTWSTWTSGNAHANTHFWSNELEGVAGEPINDDQLETALHLIEEWKDYSNDVPERRRTMWEHTEVAQMWSPNAGPTSCPSGRYERLWARLEGDSMPADTESLIQDLQARVTTLEGSQKVLEAKLTSLNQAIMDRLSLFHLGSGNVGDVREAIKTLEGSDA